MSAPRVLIVDDNEMNVELAKFVLETDGFDVESAVDAIEALERIPEFLPDLILMDIQMPGMDGLELTRLLKADPARKGILIVAFTAYAMRGDEARMRAAGCDGYLSKPIDAPTFAARVRSFLTNGDTAFGLP
ncbi:MAG: response regulator [Burkholderiaceae bacterium]